MEYLYASWSELEAHLYVSVYVPDRIKSKYVFYVKEDGSIIKQIGMKLYDQFWGAIKVII